MAHQKPTRQGESMSVDGAVRSNRLAGVAFPSTQEAPAAGTILSREDFAAFYREHLELVYRYLLARTGDVQDAQDLAAETFQAALEGRASYHPRKGTPKSWVMGIAQHKLVDHFRRSGGRAVTLDTIEDRLDGAPLPEETAHHRLQASQVAQALKRIAPDRAQAIALHFYSGLDLAETARAMRKSHAAVKKLVQRGLEDLKRGLAYTTEMKE